MYDSDGLDSDDTDYNKPRRRIRKRVDPEVYDQGWASQHRDIPQILLSYAGVFIRIFLGLLLVYCVYNIVMTVRRDIHQKIDEYAADASRDKSRCGNGRRSSQQFFQQYQR
jgi:hypothetical protein